MYQRNNFVKMGGKNKKFKDKIRGELYINKTRFNARGQPKKKKFNKNKINETDNNKLDLN